MSRLRVRVACTHGGDYAQALAHALPRLDPARYDCAVWSPPHPVFSGGGLALRRWLRRSGCDVLHAPEASLAQRLLCRGVAPRIVGPDESLRLRWGVDLEDLEARAARPLNPHPPARRDSVAVLVPAPLRAGRGHDVLMAALVPLEQGRPLDLWLVGDGPERARIARRAARFGGSVRVHMLGERDDLPALMRAADFTLLPGAGARLSLTLLESRALGRPVIASAAPGVPEAVTPAEDGLLVPPGDPLALARALARLSTCPDLRSELGRTAARDASERFDARDTARALEALYLGHGPPPFRSESQIQAAPS